LQESPRIGQRFRRKRLERGEFFVMEFVFDFVLFNKQIMKT
jgi:hypothetical protein